MQFRSNLKIFTLIVLLWANGLATPQAPRSSAAVERQTLASEINAFIKAEINAHVAAIKTLDPPPERIYGALTTGEYSWGSFMRALGAYAEMNGEKEADGRDIATIVGKIGLIEARNGARAFSQLYAALALRSFGADLNKNAVWQSLNEKERADWRSLLNLDRMYDAKTKHVINLPENYLGVAARIAAIDYQLGLLRDKEFIDSLFDSAAKQFTEGNLYADDSRPTGRYDRYSNEYARNLWEASEMVHRQDILEALRPTLKAQMRLWWDLISEDGYGYNWGRSLGVISYLDTLEIAAFLGEHAEFRPAPLSEIAAAYMKAWRWVRNDYLTDRHVLNVFAFGRGNYAYISREREWQQTGTFFGKIIVAHPKFMASLERENIKEIPTKLSLPDVSRFEFFRRGKERQAGVWLVRLGQLRFALPLTTGTKPGVADYLPAPHGLVGFAAPVEEVYPALVPFIELEDGRVFVAAEGADDIEPAPDGKSLRVVWRRWSAIGGKSGEVTDIGLTSEVTWRIQGPTLTRDEKLLAQRDMKLKRWWVAMTTTGERNQTRLINGQRVDLFGNNEGSLETEVKFDWKTNVDLVATGDSKLGRGSRGAIPFHLIYDARDLELKATKPRSWSLRLTVGPVW